ncbi:MAG: hypothetical protein LBJ43_05515 [Propionibacteriaceae bacterium]|jgi:hypothetical protein|nr:hypothetical protein [Propionibacteriaceae bacterium]
MGIGYVLQRMRNMDWAGPWRVAAKVRDRSGKNRLLALSDILWCGLIYQAGYWDYDVFQMERTNARQRATFVTRGMNNQLVKKLCDSAYFDVMRDKAQFYERFGNYLGRRWTRVESLSDAEFVAWLGDVAEVVAKPLGGMCGKGVERLRVADFSSASALLAYLKEQEFWTVEVVLQQHPELDKLYPGAINTVRIVTVTKGERSAIAAVYLRIGHGRPVDNFNSGGMVTPVDVATGQAKFSAVDKAGNVYPVHPETGTKIPGFQIPNWQACKALAKEAALRIPQLGLVGWDIASTPTGPVLVEGNDFPGHDIYQLPEHTPDGIGMLPKFQVAIAKVSHATSGEHR